MLNWIIIPIIIGWLLPSSAMGAWQGQQDNKPIAELELLNEPDLVNEAFAACEKGVRGMKPYNQSPPTSLREGYRIKREATEYLQTIELVAGKGQRDAAPQWAREMRSALLGEKEQGCLNIQQEVVEGYLKGPEEKVKKKARSSQAGQQSSNRIAQ
jgi:hypothetical protein